MQLDLHFKDIDLSAGQITPDKAKKVRDTFRDHNLPICCISGYTNIIHPDKAERQKRVGYLKEIIRNARDFGSPLRDLGNGHLQYGVRLGAPSDKNKTEEGFEECRKVIADLAQTAYDHGAVFLLETYVNNVVGSVEETVKMFAQVDHPGLGLLMDPTNYFETHNIDRMDKILNQVFDTLSDKIRIAHAKDVKRSGDDKTREARRHRRRRRAREPYVPRRRRDRTACAGSRLAQLRPLPEAAGGEASEHPGDHRASLGGRRAASETLSR